MKNKTNTMLVLGLLMGNAAWADTMQAEQALQIAKPPVPQQSPVLLPPVPAASAPASADGNNVKLVLNKVVFHGNTLFTSQVLEKTIGDIQGKSFDIVGLNRLLESVSALYRSHGYPFVQVYMPPQTTVDGILQIAILEGRYGKIQARGDEKLARSAQKFLNAGLQSGNYIENTSLERTMLILNDQPGVKVRPILRPGSKAGDGDLDVLMERASWVDGVVGLDNIGNKSTGEYRAPLSLNINSPFMLGDKITLSTLYTNQDMWLGSLNYDLPIAYSGWRGQLGYAHTSYLLAGAFASLDAKGYADVSSAKLSYPLIRSQATNVQLAFGYQHKKLEDKYQALGSTQSKTSDSLPLSLQFDHRDSWPLGGGVTYGLASLMSGTMHLGQSMLASDASTAKTQGNFSKADLDIARIQKLSSRFNLYLRYSGQWASKNLDSSEKFGLGGFYGVRAYPQGEGMGDYGWLTQLELRYDMGSATPFILYDVGRSHSNKSAWDSSSTEQRKLSATGLGLRISSPTWSLESSLAWKTQGGTPTAENSNHNPRLYLAINRRF